MQDNHSAGRVSRGDTLPPLRLASGPAALPPKSEVIFAQTLSRRRFLQVSAGAALLGVAGGRPGRLRAQEDREAPAAAGSPEDALAGPARGHWRRLFLDGAACEESRGLARIFHAAEKHPANPIIEADRPWEGISAITGPYVYGTAMREGGRFRLWYQILNRGNHVGYAESGDGVHWTKPNLGIISFAGSRDNNLVVSAAQPEAAGGHCHNPSVISCPWESDPARRYALYGFDAEAGHARVAFSADGLRWRYAPGTASHPLFRSSDVVNFFRDVYRGRYAATWKTRNRRGRAVGVTWSEDGLAWTKPVDGPVFVADDLDPDATQIYGMPVFPYQGLYIGIPWVYHARYFRFGEYSVPKLHEAQEDSPRTMDAQLAWSWDLINWTRPAERRPFIVRGAPGAWDRGMIVTARAPLVAEDRLFFYYGGCDGFHDDPRVRAAIGLAMLRLDGFCSMQAGESEGWLVTRREPFAIPAVTLNARTRPGGWVAAEILDRRNRPVPGFSRADCLAFSGDSVRHELKWKSSAFGERQRAGDYKLRFFLKEADLFSYMPCGLDPAGPDLARFESA